jgi:DNA-binding LytR/AlgR family response regulator
MNVLIIENEKPAAKNLNRLLNRIEKNINVVAVIETIEESINWFNTNVAPDLILMDIQLDDGLCFEIFESVKINTPVIFTTAYDEYAIKAFKVNSIDYLLKPVTEELLAGAIEKLKTIYPSQAITNEKLNHIYEHLGSRYKTRFFVKIGEHCKSISANEIASFYILGGCTFCVTLSGKCYDISYSLEELERLLNPLQFFRINRQTLINIDAITDIISFSKNRLKIKMPHEEKTGELLVSREKAAAFKKWLDR